MITLKLKYKYWRKSIISLLYPRPFAGKACNAISNLGIGSIQHVGDNHSTRLFYLRLLKLSIRLFRDLRTARSRGGWQRNLLKLISWRKRPSHNNAGAKEIGATEEYNIGLYIRIGARLAVYLNRIRFERILCVIFYVNI